MAFGAEEEILDTLPTQLSYGPHGDPVMGWQHKFIGLQLALFLDYELATNGKRTGFARVRVGSQNFRARLPWLSDGKMVSMPMPIPQQTLMLIGFLAGATRTYGEAVIICFLARELVKDSSGTASDGVDEIFQQAKAGEHIIRTRWNPNGDAGARDDKTTVLHVKADGSVVVVVDETADTPVKLTIDAARNVTLENAATVKATADKTIISCPDINLGGESGSEIIRKADHPQHIDPVTGVLVTSHQYTSNSQKTKSE